ncbi:heme-binding protein 2 [Lingula anatina]|uniref:Heme-binding protein 2 n=1 Tax=Lingula anatina TaxID=7574 RepID=A0A1S3J8D1_LINAN|nr:heme-binding protein 2 [Lingula anatina]|eukprot:XP_013406655.1 heme-binding protein 2 [Lingula anatina]
MLAVNGNRLVTKSVFTRNFKMTAILKTIASAFTSSGIETPSYTVVRKNEDYEERAYPATMWVSTTEKGMDHSYSVRQGFWKLFNYIQGKNEKDMKIDMTAPVATRILPGAGPNCENTFTVSFFIGKKHEGNPPKPTNPDVFLEEWPAKHVFVRSFGGFANDDKWIDHSQALANSLQKNDEPIAQDYYYTAGYDSPFKMFNRTNEVWFEKQKSQEH